MFQRFAHLRHGEHVPPRQELPHPPQTWQLSIGHLMEQPGSQPELCHARTLNGLAQFQQTWSSWREKDQTRPIQQRPPDFKGRSVKTYRSQLQENIRPRNSSVIGVPNQTHNSPVWNANAFGTAGGTGGKAYIS